MPRGRPPGLLLETSRAQFHRGRSDGGSGSELPRERFVELKEPCVLRHNKTVGDAFGTLRTNGRYCRSSILDAPFRYLAVRLRDSLLAEEYTSSLAPCSHHIGIDPEESSQGV